MSATIIHLLMGHGQLLISATVGIYSLTNLGTTLYQLQNLALIYMILNISEMNRNVLVMLMLKLTPCAQVKWDIIGDTMMAVHGLMQERASLLNASQKQVHVEQNTGPLSHARALRFKCHVC